jgi:hypothetical protein
MHISGINKRELTELLLKEAVGVSEPFKTIYPQIWANFRDDGGLRLTHVGRQFFIKNCDIDYTTLTLKTPVQSMKKVLYMDKIIECPYFLVGRLSNDHHKIELFGDQVATMLSLYDGDLDLYLEANKPL